MYSSVRDTLLFLYDGFLPNDAVVNSYPLALTNVAVSGGLLFLHTRRARARGYDWAPPFSAWKAATVFFFLSNVFLAIVPLVPPAPGYPVYKHLPYYVRSSI